MRRIQATGGALLLALLASACSSSPDLAAGKPTKTISRMPSSPGQSESGNAHGKNDMSCPQLVAKVPSDLRHRKVRRTDGKSMPASTSVIWSNGNSTRVVNLTSSISNETFGDGPTSSVKTRKVQGAVAQEVVNGDVHRVAWKQGDGPCPYWTLVTGGLSEPELEAALDSVKAAS